jgi:hypothetical protein
MKKAPMKKSVSRLIKVLPGGDLCLVTNRKRESVGVFTRYFFDGKVPKSGVYRAKFILNPRGPYDVENSYGSSIRLIRRRDQEGGMAICFGPKSWIGLRVSRRVEKVKK